MARKYDPNGAGVPDAPEPNQPKGGAKPGTTSGNDSDRFVLAAETGKAIPLCYGETRVGSILLERIERNTPAVGDAPLWQPDTVYVVGSRVKSFGNLYDCTVPGTSAHKVKPSDVFPGSDTWEGPAGTDSAISEPFGSTVVWKYSGPVPNSITPGVATLWQPNTFYALNEIRQSGGNLYLMVGPATGATSSTVGSAGNGPSGTNTSVPDGGCTWSYIKPGFRNYLVIGLCEGPIVAIDRAWQDQLVTSLTGLPHDGNQIQLFVGDGAGYSPRPIWNLAAGRYLDLYANTALVVINNSTGSDGENPNYSFEVQGQFNDPTTGYASPADILPDMLTHQRRGLGWPSTRVDTVSTGTGASSWRTYCTAAGLNLSWTIDSQQEAIALVDILLEATNTDPVWTNRPDGQGGMLKFVPRGDQTITANGVTYTPNTTPVYDLSEADFLEPLAVERISSSDTFNSFPVEYVDRASGYRRITVDDPDMVDVDTRGLKRGTTLSVPMAMAPASAVMLSRIRAQRSLNVRNLYTFKVGWRFFLLEATDVVTISDSVLGLSKVPVKIVSVEEDQSEEGSFTVAAEDYPAAVHTAAQYAPQTGDGFAPSITDTRFVVIPAQVPASTIPDSASTKGGAYHNLFPNGTSEVFPPDGADKMAPEFVGRVQVADAWAGKWVRQVDALRPSPPVLFDATTSTTGGTIPAGTRYYVATAITPSGETWVSNEVSATTTGSTSSVVISWGVQSVPPGATALRIYVGTTSGVYTSYFTASATPSTSGSYTVTSETGTAGTHPKYTDVYPMLGSGAPALNYSGGPFIPAPGTVFNGPYAAETSALIMATPGCLFRLEAMARVTAGSPNVRAEIDLQWLDANGRIIDSADVGTWSTYSTTWSRLTLRGMTLPGAVAVRATLRCVQGVGAAAAGSAQFDTISLSQEFTEKQLVAASQTSSQALTGSAGNSANWFQPGGMLLSSARAFHVYSDTREIRITAQFAGYVSGNAGPVNAKIAVLPSGANSIAFTQFDLATRAMYWNNVGQHQSFTLTWTIPAGTIPLGAIAAIQFLVNTSTGSATQLWWDTNDSYSLAAEMI